MTLDFDTWIYSKLNTITGLRVDYWYPNDFTVLPVLAYKTSQNNSDLDYQDDFAQYSNCVVDLDLYVKQGVDDFTYVNQIATIMAGLYFNLDSSDPIPDPDTKILHRHLTFSRDGIAPSDLV